MGIVTKFSNRLPVGPGSRGGKWHDPEWRRSYHRAWRAAHPEYREREARRQSLKRALARGDSITEVTRLAPVALPAPGSRCACGCGCTSVVVLVCGFCRDGLHAEER